MKSKLNVVKSAEAQLRRLQRSLNSAKLLLHDKKMEELDVETMAALRHEINLISQSFHEFNAYSNVLNT